MRFLINYDLLKFRVRGSGCFVENAWGEILIFLYYSWETYGQNEWNVFSQDQSEKQTRIGHKVLGAPAMLLPVGLTK